MRQSETEPGVATNAVASTSRPIDDPRVYLAAERTFLSWVRTSVSLMGFGFLIARFALLIREYDFAAPKTIHARPQISTWLGFGMVCVGVIVCLTAAVRHREYVRALRQGVANPNLNVNTSMILAGTLALVGLAIAIHILML
jgi:putative membrane protein